jgi:hypothetical protein
MKYLPLLLRENKLNAALFIIIGNFALVVGTSLLLTFTGRLDYLLILALSTTATIFTCSGVRPSIWGIQPFRNEWMTPIFLTGGGAVLAAEVAALLIFFQGLAPALYSITTLTACYLMLLGSDILVKVDLMRRQPTYSLQEEKLVIERLTI